MHRKIIYGDQLHKRLRNDNEWPNIKALNFFIRSLKNVLTTILELNYNVSFYLYSGKTQETLNNFISLTI